MERLDARLPLATDFGLVQDINQTVSQVSSSPEDFAVVGTMVYFRAESETGVELWKSDGTNAGTVAVTNFTGSRTPPIIGQLPQDPIELFA